MQAAKLDAQVRAARMHLKDFDTPAEHRWSELVPPRTALTFAAIWDPDEGMVTFSGARLLDSETADKGNANAQDKGFAHDSPCDVAFADDQSQVLTIDQYAFALYDDPPSYSNHGHHPYAYAYAEPLPSAGADSLAFARDALADAETCMDSHSCLTPGGLRVPQRSHDTIMPDSPAVASSMALASMANVPSRRTRLMNNPFRRSRDSHSSTPNSRRPDLRVHTDDEEYYEGRYCGERVVDSGASDVTDEGFFEDRRLTTGTFGSAPVLVEVNLSSAFSVTTTSTSRYVEVDRPSHAEKYSCENTCVNSDVSSDRMSDTWSTLRDADRQICFNVPLELGRRLKKQKHHRHSSRSPPATPADPAEVLARRNYNHTPSSPSSPGSWGSDPSTWSGVFGCHGRNGCGPSAGSSPSGSPTRMGSIKRTLHRVVPCKKHEGKDERWVYVEVEHKVKQRVCEVCV